MPFTPLHMGPGLAIKAVVGRRFSLMAFGVAQVAMDLEPLIGMLRGSEVLHGPTHTYLATPFIALLAALATPPICRPILRRWNRELAHYRLERFAQPDAWSWPAVILGAVTGTLSHVVLDSVMHADITPLAPWSDANALHQFITLSTLHTFCLLAGAFGVGLWLLRGVLGRWAPRDNAGERNL